MFSISIVDVAMGLYVFVAIIAIKAIVYVIRLSIAQRRVNKAYKSLMTWSRRLEWAIEDGSWLDADNIEFSIDEVKAVFEKRKIAFNKAVDQRNLIRF
jgi:hypothetical protein